MTEQGLLDLRDLAEVGRVQFKERIDDKYAVGCEMVAMSNSHGGRLVIGINDKTGVINAMAYKELQDTTNLLTNMASENVVPSILIDIDTVKVKGGAVVVATIPEGKNKPYHDNKGIIWVKNGADKRKVFDNAELAEMMSECGQFAPDEAAVPNATIADLDENELKIFLCRRFAVACKNHNIIESDLRSHTLDEVLKAIASDMTLEQLLRNMRLIRPDGQLTTTAILLLGSYPQRWLPNQAVKCVTIAGNNIGGTTFLDKVLDSEMEGPLRHQFETIMAFLSRNLRTIQPTEEFNSVGEKEISLVGLQELVVNALVHRSLNWNTPIRIFVLDNRIEIHSPGVLPCNLTVEAITAGTSLPRNSLLFLNANFLLPYSGIGTGVSRAINEKVAVSFTNSEMLHEFLVTISRQSNQEIQESNQETVISNEGSNQEHPQSNQERRPKVTKQQEDILNFCSVPRTAQEIMDRLGISNQSKNRSAHIRPLVEAGLLGLTIPENPTDRNQKYKKVKK